MTRTASSSRPDAIIATARSGSVRASLAAAVLAAALIASCSSESTDTAEPSESASTTTTTTDTTDTTSSETLATTTTQQPATATTATAPSSVPGGTPTTGALQAGRQVIDSSLRTPDGRDRTYRLYIPASLPTESDVPLLVALHGGTGWGIQFELNSGFDAIAESAGFIVVYPDGVGTGADGTSLRTWNGGYCCGFAARSGVDDVGFIRLLIDEISRQYPIDPARVFAAGHSNGGIMSYRLACELSDRIVAVGLQAGSLGIDTCRPPQAVSVLHIHGTADLNHPIDGGVGPNGISGVDFRSALWSVEQLATANGCAASPARATDAANPDLTTSGWTGCRGGAEVALLAVEGASHAWMGATSGGAWGRSGEPYADLSSSAAIWAFLAAHPRR